MQNNHYQILNQKNEELIDIQIYFKSSIDSRQLNQATRKSQTKSEKKKIVVRDLEKENTLFEVLERLYHDRIIDEETKDNWLVNYREFVEIIQNNYMVMPTYTNERLRKQSGKRIRKT